MRSAADLIKKLLPSWLKGLVKESRRRWRFQSAFARYAAVPAHNVPSNGIVQDLISSWGNEGYSAMTEYILALREHASQSTGPILECGSGLSTLVLGLEASRRGLQVWSLEHDMEWTLRMRREIARLGLDSIVLCKAPLKDFGSFTWYDAPLKSMPSKFALAVCDGPPGNTRGGRYGLIELLRDRFRPGAIVLLDDYNRPEEQEIAQRWVRETGSTIDSRGDEKPYAVLRLPRAISDLEESPRDSSRSDELP